MSGRLGVGRWALGATLALGTLALALPVGTLAASAAPASAPSRLGAPRPDGDGVSWSAEGVAFPEDLLPWRAGLDPASATDSSRRVAWRALAQRSRWRLYALHRLASLELALGDTTAADTALAALGEAPGIWQWQARLARAGLALARRDSAAALARLGAGEHADWPDDERAQEVALRAQLLAGTGDSAQAITLGAQALRRFPSAAPIARLLPRWEAWVAGRGLLLTREDQRAAAEVEFWKPDRSAAAARLERTLRLLPRPERAPVERRIGEMLRLARRFSDAARTLTSAAHDAADDAERARIELERARVERDADHSTTADRHFGRAAALAAEPGLRELALWERARDLEHRGEWKRSRADYAQVAALGLARAPDAALRAGLLWYLQGRPDSARAAWERSGSEAGAFWTAISMRGDQRAAADSALGLIAARPGYSFYRTAARDTLARPGRPAGVVPAPAPDSGDETLALARDLIAIGEGEDAALLLQRWYAGDARLPAHGRSLPRRPGALLQAARLAYAAGRPALGIQIARRAIESVPETSLSERWSLVPWAYPPCYDLLVSARVPAGDSTAIARDVVMALIWQESKFDAGARSRSNALGLMQLKTGTAAALARKRREPAPGEAALLDPAMNVKLGTRLLDELVGTFGRQLTLVLAAYNAGPVSAARWSRPEVVGGEALEAELFEYAETQDYVKSILGARQAYREWRPRSTPPGAGGAGDTAPARGSAP